jgi:hypothetical protein
MTKEQRAEITADSKIFEAKLRANQKGGYVFADDNPNYHRNKLLGGIFRIAFVVAVFNIFGVHWGEKASPILRENISAVIGVENGNFVGAALVAIAYIMLVIIMVKGVYKILTFNQYIDVYEGKNLLGIEMSQKTNTERSNIDKVYAFRDAKMTNMTRDKAADLHIKTSKLGGSASNPKVEGYINSKLSWMSPSKGLDFLKGK